MKIENEFAVASDIDRVWAELLDLESVAGCLPGAELRGADASGAFEGRMRLKLGAVALEYQGTAAFRETDPVGKVAVVAVTGKEVRGQGSASATITSTLVPEGARTRVRVSTDFTVVGRAAQFGRGLMVEVADRVLREFAARLEARLANKRNGPADGDVGGSATPSQDAPPSVPKPNQALDLGPLLLVSMLRWIMAPLISIGRRLRGPRTR